MSNGHFLDFVHVFVEVVIAAFDEFEENFIQELNFFSFADAMEEKLENLISGTTILAHNGL
jgi:hypothetical protein